MLRTITSTLLAVLIFNFCCIIQTQGQNISHEADTAKIKADLTKRGIGEKSKVKIEMRDGQVTKGYIVELNADDFVIANSKSGERTTLAYSDVKKIKKQGLSLGACLAILGLAAGASLVIAIAANRKVKCSICP